MIPIESATRHDHVEVARTATGLVNEIYRYDNEQHLEEEKLWTYDLTIIRVGGQDLTREQIAALAGVDPSEVPND